MSGPKCLRCGADSSWLQGSVPNEPPPESGVLRRLAAIEAAARAVLAEIGWVRDDNVAWGGKSQHEVLKTLDDLLLLPQCGLEHCPDCALESGT